MPAVAGYFTGARLGSCALAVFKGDAASWVGAYQPGDQLNDPENVGDWQVWYRIEKM